MSDLHPRIARTACTASSVPEHLSAGSQVVVVGLGYVGAPLAVALAKYFDVSGFDISTMRVEELRAGRDRTNEIPAAALRATSAVFTTDATVLARADVIVVTVPTPVDGACVPDLNPVVQASIEVGRHMKRGAIVVYESTVYPGVTEEVCVPLLAQHSGLVHLRDFHVGYSPERISPGDLVNTLTTTTKIVAGDTPEVCELLADLYGRITQIHRAPSIKVAEAAKVLENTQRDVNIGLVNQVSQLLGTLGVDTHDVLAAARSKWNFLDFRPGLVGGHCISVDPYYLTHKAATCGFTPSIVLAARETNDGMAGFVVDQLLRSMTRHHLLHADTVVTILGVTFKEDVPDIRNSKVVDIVRELDAVGIRTQVMDPLADSAEVEQAYGFALMSPEQATPAHAVVLAVPHASYLEGGWALLESLGRPQGTFVVSDLKAVLSRTARPERAILWRP
ncbi:UDP-N-acetyl-D-galactosamine dehydrogenase [Cupriavidus sp. YR651]|uniref:nucleotide sugar dehydrogenase n=1 Tax=Cupriavidus sp. YR651 TaxID=1855315 RepID=UPI00088C1B58|nr:nucleotide sugar dehydrogenase [Cupriavidus sp. YR651]SDD14763.1 UDP-N-acetyl-D-galactosamine dehydrogenase [Cupriavidus sp. YR651]